MKKTTITISHDLYTDQIKLEVKLKAENSPPSVPVPVPKEQQTFDITLYQRTEYFNFLNERGLI